MKIFVLLFFAIGSLVMASCGSEQVTFVVETDNYNPYASDTTGSVGGLAVNLDLTLLESTSRKSHVSDINRQLVDRFIGNANLELHEAMTLYRDSLLRLPLPDAKTDSLGGDSTVAAPRYTASVRIYTDLMEGDLVTFVYEGFENYSVQPGKKQMMFLAFDLKTGRQLHEQDVFDCSDKSKAQLDKLLREALEEKVAADTNGIEMSRFGTEKLHINDNFRVAAQSLIYHFDAGVLADEEVGPVDLEIPSYKLHQFLNQESLVYRFWFNNKK